MTRWLGLDACPRLTTEESLAYDAARKDSRARVLIQTVTAICIFYLCYSAVDYLLIPDVFQLAILLRFGIILPLTILLLSFLRSAASIQAKEIAALGVSVSGNLMWCIILVSSESPSVLTYYYAAVVFQTVIAIAAKTPFIPTLIASLITFAINYSFIWFLQGSTPDYVWQHFVIYFPVVCLTLVTCHQLQAERLTVFQQAYENETLKAELSAQNAELARLSFTDPLTRLANRRGTGAALKTMREEIPQGMARAALFLIDVDHFKAFNDSYGHAAGDACLTQLAAALTDVGGPSMHIGRHGGEEFLAILPDCDRAQAAKRAEQLCDAVRGLSIDHEFHAADDPRLTISIGVVCGPIERDEQLLALSKQADDALYAAKKDGRNGWVIAPQTATIKSSAA